MVICYKVIAFLRDIGSVLKHIRLTIDFMGGYIYIYILTEEKRAFVSYRKSKLSSETCLDFKGRIYITYLVLLKQLF